MKHLEQIIKKENSKELDPAVIGAIGELMHERITLKQFSDMVLSEYLLKNDDQDPMKLMIAMRDIMQKDLPRLTTKQSAVNLAESFVEKAFQCDEERIRLEALHKAEEDHLNDEFVKLYKAGSGGNLSSEYRELEKKTKETFLDLREAKINAWLFSVREQILTGLIIPYFDYFKKK